MEKNLFRNVEYLSLICLYCMVSFFIDYLLKLRLFVKAPHPFPISIKDVLPSRNNSHSLLTFLKMISLTKHLKKDCGESLESLFKERSKQMMKREKGNVRVKEVEMFPG